jgi:tetratricopeptide (TPR) repeat protein
MRAALELFRSRNYPCVVAVVTDALDLEPDCVPLRLLRARAWLALRRDLDAQADLGHVLRLDARCGTAYRLLGELAARKDELASAKIFLREAQRLDPDDRETSEWLALVDDMVRPTAAAEKLPAAAAAVGHFRSSARARSVTGPGDDPTRPSQRALAGARGRFATVGHPPGAAPPRADHVARVDLVERISRIDTDDALDDDDRGDDPVIALVDSRPPATAGFGQYLVEIGVMTPLQLRASLAYQRSAGIRLGAAAIALGFASAPKIEWASLAYHGRYRRGLSLGA